MADYHSNSVPLPKFPLSAHDLSHVQKLCCRIGDMNCHLVEECIPSDIAHIKTDLFVRLDPLTFPIMHKIKVRQNFFFVPTRLILGDELNEEFFSCKDMNAKLPRFEFTGSDLASNNILGKNSLFDQMEGQPVLNPDINYTKYTVRNALPFFMLQQIWKDYYADEILDASDIQNVDFAIDQYRAAGLDGVVTLGGYAFNFHQVSWSKDRFTSAQTDAQRVGEVYLMNPLNMEPVGDTLIANSNILVNASTGNAYVNGTNTQSGNAANMRPTLTIDELWDEMVVQRFLNSMNEFGNERYVEILAGQFGVISADARLQRAQWIGGNEMVVNISEILQTSESTQNNPLGSFAGKGIVAGRGRDIAFKVPEHGFIIGVLTFVPENGYASGSARWLYKSRPLDFAFPRFNNLGESAVLNGELYSDHKSDADTNDLGEFGYQPQFDEYRVHPSRSTGDFRDSALLAWHLDRKFTSVPPLNKNFIHIDPSECNRIFNDEDVEARHMRVLTYHKEMFVRPISKHPVPGKL